MVEFEEGGGLVVAELGLLPEGLKGSKEQGGFSVCVHFFFEKIDARDVIFDFLRFVFQKSPK